jgi:Na+/proline symporter
MVVLFALYGVVVIAISLWYRKHATGDEYLMGNRQTSALLVASALFTLVGGGELVTLTALSYTYGFAALSLFGGYALSFCFLGIISKRIRKDGAEQVNLSLPDYVHAKYGAAAGHIAYLISFGAFFSMLLIQFIAGGQVISSLTSLTYVQSVIVTAAICTTYLFIGGFKTVLATDLLQGAARLLLMPLLVFVAAKGLSTGVVTKHVEVLPGGLWISLIITGFFSASASADVWQRIYVAKSNNAARWGLISGAFLLMLFGLSLVGLGLIAKSSGMIGNADNAFVQSLSTMLPRWALVVAIILVLSTVMSTADTEMFLVSGMTLREILRIKGNKSNSEIKEKQSVFGTRILMIVITACAVLLALRFNNLISIYTWLLSALLIMAPVILASLFFPNNVLSGRISLILNLILFVVLAFLGILTPDNSYLIVVPGLAVYLFTYLFSNSKRVTNKRI